MLRSYSNEKFAVSSLGYCYLGRLIDQKGSAAIDELIE